MDIFAKLDSAEARYNDINAELSSGTVSGQDLTSLLKEQGELEPVISTYREFKKFRQAEADSKTIISGETDPDLIEMAKEELAEAREKCSELEQELKILLIPKDPLDDKNIILYFKV